MAYDKDSFAQELKNAGLNDDEIAIELKNMDALHAQPTAPSTPKAASQTVLSPPPTVQQQAQKNVQGLSALAQEREKQDQTVYDQYLNPLEKALDTDVGKIGAGVLGGAALVYGGTKLKDRFFSPSGGGEINRNIDIPFDDGPPAPPAPPPSNKLPSAAQLTDDQWRSQLSPQEQEMLAKSDAAKAAKAATQAPQVTPEPPKFILNQPPVVGEAPPVAPQKAPVAPPVVAPETAEQPKEKTKKKAGRPPKSSLPPPDMNVPEGMREQYNKPKGGIGPGGYNWFASQVGEDAPKRWEEQYGKRNVPAAQVQEDYSKTRYPPTQETNAAKSGGSFGRPKYIPDYIRGSTNLNGAYTAGLTGLAAILLAPSIKQAIKSGKEGDIGMAAAEASNVLNLHPLGMLANNVFGLTPEELKILRKSEQAKKVDAGRGIAPPSAYKR